MADFDNLSDDDKMAIYYATLPSAVASIRAGQLTGVEVARIERLDTMVSESKLRKGVVMYKKVKGELAPGQPVDVLKDGGELTEPAYLFGSAEKPDAVGDGEVILAIEIEEGYPALALPGGYLTHRGRKLELDKEEDGVVPAHIVGSENINTQEPEEDTMVATGGIKLSG